MLKHKCFLKSLYQETKGYINKRQIDKATRQERKVVLQILFCISQGHIFLKKQHLSEVIQSKRKKKLEEIGKNLKKLLKSSDQEQKACLKQFSSLYKQLFWYMFNKPKQ